MMHQFLNIDVSDAECDEKSGSKVSVVGPYFSLSPPATPFLNYGFRRSGTSLLPLKDRALGKLCGTESLFYEEGGRRGFIADCAYGEMSDPFYRERFYKSDALGSDHTRGSVATGFCPERGKGDKAFSTRGTCFLTTLPSAGLSELQSNRFEQFMEASPMNHRPVLLKVLELLHYWIASPGVGEQLEALLKDTLRQVGGSGGGVVREAWGEVSKPEPSRPSSAPQSRAVNIDDRRPCNGESVFSSTKKHKQPVVVLPSPATTADAMSSTPSRRNFYINNKPEKDGLRDKPVPPLQISPNSTGSAKNFRAQLHIAQSIRTEAKTEDRGDLEIPSRQNIDALSTPAKHEGSSENGRVAQDYGTASFLVEGSDGANVAFSGGAGSTDHNAGASYGDLPQFYFPLGQPWIRERVLSGPLILNRENPHLRATEVAPIANTMYCETKKINIPLTDRANTVKVSTAPRIVPISTLRCMDDNHINQYLQKEFSRVPPPPRLNQKVRLVSNRVRGSRGVLSLAKQEANYRHLLLLCLQRVCVNCFGIPRYFAFILLQLLQSELVGNTSSSPCSSAGSRPGSSYHSVTKPSCLKPVTLAQLRDFYSLHLKGKDIVRRVFDMLILSSKLRNYGSTANLNQERTRGRLPLESSISRSVLLPKDFVAYIHILLQHHPGLSFLKQNTDFQPKYLNTVIYRIFYEVDRYDRGFISFAEFASSRLIDALRQVDESEDINAVLLFFSYKHFYVLYCRFWGLDEDQDMMLSPEDLSKYSPGSIINPLILERIFNGVGRRVRCPVKGRIGYEDFVWFCLSEEDKTTPQAIRYWFRILDLDGDGILSLHELHTFYEIVREKMESIERDGGVTFRDVLCQIFDMMRCQEYRGLFLEDFLREREAAHVTMSMLTNVVKFMHYEQQDPFVVHQERLIGGLEQTPWDRFARIEYDLLTEEAGE